MEVGIDESNAICK